MRAVLFLLVAGCFSKPPRPDDDGSTPKDGPSVEAGPRVLQHTTRSRNDGGSLSYTISIQDEPDRYLLVTVQVGGSCTGTVPPITLAEAQDPAMNSLPLTSIASIPGTPCNEFGAQFELYELRSPPVGSLSINIALAGIAPALHSAAIAFANVDGTTPTREIAHATGESALTSVKVDAVDGDLIVNTTGHGTALENPGPKETEIFRTNVDSTTTLNNSGASIVVGRTGLVEMTWEAVGVDQWSSISTPLRSPGAP